LRNAQQVDRFRLRKGVALRQVGRELAPTREVPARLPLRLLRALAEVRPCAEEREHLALLEALADDLGVAVDLIDRANLPPTLEPRTERPRSPCFVSFEAETRRRC